MRPKPVKDVKTFDGKMHEVDIRVVEKSYIAWAFVESKLIEGHRASTQEKAVVNWKKEYQTLLDPTPPKPKKAAAKKVAVPEEADASAELAAPEEASLPTA